VISLVFEHRLDFAMQEFCFAVDAGGVMAGEAAAIEGPNL
jgi:hypothetical protein